MGIYTIHSVDHGDNIWHSEEIDRATDAEAIAEAMRRHGMLPIGAGFDLYREDALVHRHREKPRGSG